MRIILSFSLIIFLSFQVYSQEKEVLLIGTMHTVPKIAKNSYKPLLRRAIKYNLEAIYVERPRANDTISWEYLKDGWSKDYKKFYRVSDSLKSNFQYSKPKLNRLLEKRFESLSDSELQYIINSFGYLRDNANYEFYKYVKKYGVAGSKKPTRHEDGDLTAKLAIELGIKRLKSMDDQQTSKEYHTAWTECVKDGRENGDHEINKKLNKKAYNSAIIPALFRGLGMHTNKRKSLERVHRINSFSYVKNKTVNCSLAQRFWNERNKRIAKNIGEQILSNSEKKNVVIIGAGHIIGIEKRTKRKLSRNQSQTNKRIKRAITQHIAHRQLVNQQKLMFILKSVNYFYLAFKLKN